MFPGTLGAQLSWARAAKSLNISGSGSQGLYAVGSCTLRPQTLADARARRGTQTTWGWWPRLLRWEQTVQNMDNVHALLEDDEDCKNKEPFQGK